jgi:hypothetical protein
VIVTVVLLNVALMCTTARLTLRLVFRFLALATCPSLLIYLYLLILISADTREENGKMPALFDRLCPTRQRAG